MKLSKRFITKLYNASKFTIMQLGDFNKNHCYDTTKLLPIDQWILQKINETMLTVMKLLDEYEIGQARHEIDALFWKDFCDYYIEFAKERLYQPQKHGTEQRYSGQYALYHGLFRILKLYAIYTPYVTDSIYQKFYRKQEETASIHQLQWNTFDTQRIYIEFGEHVKVLFRS